MLYVFHVDMGRMLTLDMSLAVDSVASLQQQIALQYNVPLDRQVLLASGGECLDPKAKVCSYSAGTDTNPIFLFCKYYRTEDTPKINNILASTDCAADELCALFLEDIKQRIADTENLPAVYQTVVVRCQVAVQFHEMAREEYKLCESMVHDQHLQMQGWSAVIANLDDITVDLAKRVELFRGNLAEFLEEREAYVKLVESYPEDREILSQIPILPALLSNAGTTTNCDLESSCTENKSSEEKTDDMTVTKSAFATLLDWMVTEEKDRMATAFKFCAESLTRYTEVFFEKFLSQTNETMVTIDNPEMKEIKGIGDRLYRLDGLLTEVKNCMQEQADLAQAFQQNQNRANNLGDASVLPDLCNSHRKQLQRMLENHIRICGIRQRMASSKKQLCENIIMRLQWIVYIESQILLLNQTLIAHNENLRRLKNHFDALKQVHLAPSIYIASVSEVVRRRAFSQAFLLFASDMACQLLTIFNDEVARRKEFQAQFEGHFLTSLFPGMEDMPPSYGTQAPSIFDSGLPKLTVADVLKLKEDLPRLTEHLVVPDNVSAPLFPVIREKGESDGVDEGVVAVEEKLVQVVSEVGLASNLDENFLKGVEGEAVVPTAAHGLPHLKDLDRGCESETDTEEFEKVGQSPLDLHFDKEIPSPKSTTTTTTATTATKQDASTSTAEVGEKPPPLPPKKPPRTFQKLQIHPEESAPHPLHRTLSVSSSNTDSFTNVKLDEVSRNFCSDSSSCFNSHHQQQQQHLVQMQMHSKSVSPQSPVSPTMAAGVERGQQGHQPTVVSGGDFVTDEYYIDESLPSSLSLETGQSQGEFVRQLDTANNVVALLQENLETSRTEQDRLKAFLEQMSNIACENIRLLRTELNALRGNVVENETSVQLNFKDLVGSFNQLLMERDFKEREMVLRLTADHETELEDYRRSVEQKAADLERLGVESMRLEDALKKVTEENGVLQGELRKISEEFGRKVEELENRVKEVVEEKEKAVKKTKDHLLESHKAEMESIRSRFKLMMTDRSPSESSLEKIEIKDDARYTKAEMEAALLQEKEKFQRALKELHMKYQAMQQDADGGSSELLAEKERTIVELQERVGKLNSECMRYRSRIQQLASGGDTKNPDLSVRIHVLENEKIELLYQVEELRRQQQLQQLDLAASVAVLEGKVDAPPGPPKTHKLRHYSASLNTCKPGDLVLVVWSAQHENYLIHQESRYKFFVHSDCLDKLGLKMSGAEPRKLYCIGEVEDKEYCHARKADNRFRVPKGTRFYRVKVKPFVPTERDTTDTTSSQTTTTAETTTTTPPSQMTQSQQITTQSAGVQELQQLSSSHSVPATPTKLSQSTAESTTSTLQESQMCESTATSVVYESSLESLTEAPPDGAAAAAAAEESP